MKDHRPLDVLGVPGRLLLGTNWKMHKTIRESLDYVDELLCRLAGIPDADRVQVFLIPPYPAIGAVKQRVGERIWVGAQNMHWAAEGAYTGEISAPMLRELGIDLVELGHSERRAYFNETDAAVNRKVLTAVEFGFRALVCVGESSEERDAGVGGAAVTRQIGIAFHGVAPGDAGRLMVAYEPYWSIGTGGTPASPGYVRGIRDCIGEALIGCFGREAAPSVPVLYGGSVNLENAAGLLVEAAMDGLFVGRAAWQPAGMADLVRRVLAHPRATAATQC